MAKSNAERYKLRTKKMQALGKVPMFFYILKTHHDLLAKRVGPRKLGAAMQALVWSALYTDSNVLKKSEEKIEEIFSKAKSPTQSKAA